MKNLIKMERYSFHGIKLDLKMKLTFYLFLISLFQVQANTYSQNTKITLQLENTSIENVLREIEIQTEFKILYNDKEVDYKRVVSVDFKKTTVSKILDDLFSKTNIVYELIDKQIVLIKDTTKKQAPKKTAVLQKILLKGIVTDESEIPLPGATVIVKETKTGTTTDFDGNFSLEVGSDAVTLVVSYIGFETQEIVINNQTSFTIQLLPSSDSLEEVVIVGYGSQKKSDLTGSVSTVNVKEIDKYTYNDATQALQGRMAGVSIQPDGGSPGADVFVTIRGSGTLSDNGPLYVIDGMITGSMASLNPADIGTITVLKDASASAIYGSRAANGVVIVTTKKGRKGGISIDADYSYGVESIVNKIDYANARQYADISNRARDNDGSARVPANDTSFNPNFTSDIQNESLRSAAVKNLNLRLSGGSENALYSLSLNHYDREGIVKESAFERTTARFNTSFTKNKFKLESTAGLTRTIRDINPHFNQERDLIPTIRTTNDAGEFSAKDVDQPFSAYYGVGSARNSLGLATIEDRTVKRNSLLGNINASLEVIEGLTYKLNFGVEVYAQNNFRFTPLYHFNEATLGNTTFAELDERNTNFLSTLTEHTLNYTKATDKHNFNAIIGYTEQLNNTRYLGALVRNFPSNDLRNAESGADRVRTPSSDLTSGLISYFGRLNYSFDDRYLITASIRQDQSSLFKESLRKGVFPSFALGWNMSNEKFLEDVTSIQNIKLRMSYGELGSNNIGIYSITPSLNLVSEAVFGDGGQARFPGYSITRGVNSNVKWETTKTTDIGVEFSLLDQKVSVTMDYFIKKSEDVLVSLPPNLFTGFDNDIPQNAANLENKGFEFFTSYTDQIGEWNFNASLNFSTLKNEVTSLGGGSPITSGGFTSNGERGTRTDIGQPIGAFYGYVTDGIYQTDAEATAANDSNNPQAGDIRFKDLDGDGDVDEEDRTYLGSGIPTFMYGINLTASYKNFDFNFFFDGVSGNKILNGIRYRGYFDTEGNYLADALNAWTPQNTSSNIPRNTLSDPGYNRRMSDFYLEDGSFFRLKNVQIGYSLPNNILKSMRVSKLRLYASATNLFTLTKYTGYYPEVGRNNRTGGSPRLLSAGVDEGAYPTPKTFQLGLQVSF